MSSIDLEKVNQILAIAIKNGNEILQTANAPAYGDSLACEIFLVSLLKQACASLDLDENIIIHHGGHSFPDVTILHSHFGIEIKGAKAHRSFNGNSVIASTMKTGLKKVFLMYWIGDDREVGYRDYFECVATPVVTHSPRFQLDIDLAPSNSMFGDGADKVGLVEDIIFGGKNIDSEKIIQWMANKAKAKGETPWWISTDESLPVGSTGLSKFTNLSVDKRNNFLKEAFLAFPKIFDRGSNTKYNGFFEWAVQKRSIYTSRDDYSAGGKVEIIIPSFSTSPILVPQVIQVATDALQDKSKIYLNELENSTTNIYTSSQAFLDAYASILKKYLKHIYEDVKESDKGNIGSDEFASLLATYLISKIDVNTLVV
ncbi:hypothetical protein A4F89_10380 [Polynucleobacter asymbioticus]|jgi:hypothetical protein|uniref:hypothetical protein n=1 Tax=Polynucleobacter asymbioticus TaxID=576611 RepID=UPI0008FB7917|nr:hypothetical protein [Polynucleobacter asymbioticus]APB99712.1 hypothetical protein A4F89_10380 [Polynucleobacter asymbioticus]